MQTATTLKEYKSEVDKALNNKFQRKALDNFARAYPVARANAFAGMNIDQLIQKVTDIKGQALGRLDQLYAQFKVNAEQKGIHVHLAADADEANRIIAAIAKNGQAKKVVKSKSMTAEETLLNHHLEAQGLEVTETDLGEWIIQLRHEGPTHMVMPAIHLSRYQVADLFSYVTGSKQASEIERLVKVARRELRQKFVEADMGVSGANFALADTATIGLTTNEGNARLVTTLPRIHVALVGLDKLLPTLEDALHVNRVLPRNATGQAITSYVTWITGPNPCAAGEAGKKEMHIVFLDNGRRALAKDPVFSQVLRCVRCGACANVCPVYRMVGGHQLGHIYIGAIGLIATYFFHGRDKAKNLVQNCINCGACKAVCAAGIDLPGLIKEIHARIQDETDHPLSSVLLGKLLANRTLFHRLLRTAQKAQAPVVKKNGFIRHLPLILSKEHNFRALPAIAKNPFRDRWDRVKESAASPKYRVALFAGCVQDFVYPEQLEAGVRLMARHGAAVDFPMQQSCCGLPAMMMGEKAAARDVARINMAAMGDKGVDYIVTLCASCASHLKHNYPKLFEDDPAMKKTVQQFADKVIAFSTFMNEKLQMPEAKAGTAGPTTTYHAPCHLCRGMGERHAPHELIRKAGLPFVAGKEEETCCGFGGSFSGKFPQISSQILENKLADVDATGAELLVTECPGCLMQLRGGVEKKGLNIEVKHIAEALVDRK